jgi:amino acid permease
VYSPQSPKRDQRLVVEDWLSFLKVATIVVFIIVGILVNVGVNESHTYIGTQLGYPWRSVRWWFWWFRQDFRDSQSRM